MSFFVPYTLSTYSVIFADCAVQYIVLCCHAFLVLCESYADISSHQVGLFLCSEYWNIYPIYDSLMETNSVNISVIGMELCC